MTTLSAVAATMSVVPSWLRSPTASELQKPPVEKDLRGLKRSVAIAQEHQHFGGDIGAHRQIGIAALIEGAYPNRYRTVSGRVIRGRLKRAVAVAQQHGHGISKGKRARARRFPLA
jgi:hypothetical protein